MIECKFHRDSFSKNSVQTLAQVLILSGDCDAAANRVLALRDALRDQKLRLDKTYTLPSLGVLALLPVEKDSIVQDILGARGADAAARFIHGQGVPDFGIPLA